MEEFIYYNTIIWYNGNMANHLKPNNCICKNCNKSFKTNSAYLKRGGGKYCSVFCLWDYKRKNAPIWIDKAGYPTRRRVRFHRTIMEEYLGRKLKQNEHVHHINGNKSNYDISNLKLINESEHHKLHPTKTTTRYVVKCLFCGREFYTTPAASVQFCTLGCYWKAKKGTWQEVLKK